MSVTELRKLKNSEIKALSEVLAKSDYCFDIIKIKDIKINDIANFVKINLDYFHVLLVNNEIRGFSFAYSLNKAPVKYEFFKDYFSFLKKLSLKFSNKFDITNLNSNDYIIDYIYFDKNYKENFSMFIKYLEIEKLRNNSPNMFTHSHYLTEKDKGQKIINFENLALYSLVQKNSLYILGGAVEKIVINLINLFIVNNTFADSGLEISMLAQLENAKQTNELLAILLLLLIWLLYRYRKNQSINEKKREQLHNLVYYNEITELPNKNKFHLDAKANLFLNFKGVFVSMLIDNISRLYEQYNNEKISEILEYLGKSLQEEEKIEYMYHYDSGAFILFINDTDDGVKKFCKEFSSELSLSLREPISLSFGLHEVSKEENLSEIYRITRVAARLAKRFSYEKILFANHEEIEKYQESLRIEEDIPRALMENEFIPYFQPKVNLITNEVVGCEALIRWKHFSGKMIYPDSFISIAEENNTIIDLDLMIAEKSIEIVKYWLDNKMVSPDFRLSFNLSAKTFISPGILLKIMTILSKNQYNPKNLEIELTETIVISDYDHFSNIIKELNLLGINIALDDFTAGYSSTEYLTNLKIDTVKLDRALIIETENDSEKGIKKRGMYRMLTQMINQMGLNVVSEGLDDEKHYNLIKEAGVQIGQGYYFSKPLNKEDFIDFINNHNKK